MHKIFVRISAAILFCFFNVFGQNYVKQGTWEVGGSFSLSSTSAVRNGEATSSSVDVLTLNVPVYYFVIDGLEYGLIPGFEYVSADKSSITFLIISLGMAYNIKLNGNAFPFIEGRFGYNTTSNGDKRNGIVWAILGGLKFEVGDNALFRFGLGYQQSTLEKSNSEGGRDGTNSFGIDAGFALFFN